MGGGGGVGFQDLLRCIGRSKGASVLMDLEGIFGCFVGLHGLEPRA